MSTGCKHRIGRAAHQVVTPRQTGVSPATGPRHGQCFFINNNSFNVPRLAARRRTGMA
jgi:hypothetical protein